MEIAPTHVESSSGKTSGLSVTAFISASKTARTPSTTSLERHAPEACTGTSRGPERSSWAARRAQSLPAKRRNVVGRNHGAGLVADAMNRRVHGSPSAVPCFQGPRTEGVGPFGQACHPAPERSHPCLYCQHHLRPVDEGKPSLGPSSRMGQPSSCNASPERHLPAVRRITTSPSPINGNTKCARGAKSPDAPSEPWLGTTGNTPWFAWSSNRCTVATATPECPWLKAFTFKSSMAFTTSRATGLQPACMRISRFPLQALVAVHPGGRKVTEPGVDHIQRVPLRARSTGRRNVPSAECPLGTMPTCFCRWKTKTKTCLHSTILLGAHKRRDVPCRQDTSTNLSCRFNFPTCDSPHSSLPDAC